MSRALAFGLILGLAFGVALVYRQHTRARAKQIRINWKELQRRTEARRQDEDKARHGKG